MNDAIQQARRLNPPREHIKHRELGKTQELTSRLPLRKTIPLRKRKVIKSSFKGICWLLFFTVLSGLAIFFSYNAKGAPIPPSVIIFASLIFLGVLAWEITYPLLYFVTYYYDIDRDNVIIRKGIIARREITLPFVRITDVYVEQDILDVFLGLYNVYISSPTVESGKFAHIGGVDKEGARLLREKILNGINSIQYYSE